MKLHIKIFLIASVAVLLLIVGVILWFLNPNDQQYRAAESEVIAGEAYVNGDMDTFVKYMSNHVTLKYHAPILLYFTLTDMGRYDDAINAVNSFEKYHDYGYCVAYDGASRFLCRIIDLLNPVVLTSFYKNYFISRIYFEKGDFKAALESGLKIKKEEPCFKSKLYSSVQDWVNANKYIKACEADYAPKKYKYGLYLTKGYMYLRQKKYDVALDYLNKSIRKVSDKQKTYRGNNPSYLLLAELYKEINKPEKARYYYELVLKSDPYNYKAQLGLGLIKN